MIIVEGPDGAGKTTLINQLVEGTGLKVAPRVVDKNTNAMVDLARWVHINLRMGWQDTIFDRHRLISEPIYGPIMREKMDPDFTDWDWFAGGIIRLYSIKPIVIYCLPPLSVVRRNLEMSDDNSLFHDKPEKVNAIYGAYLNKAATEHTLYANTWIYDYTNDSAEVFRSAIIDHINAEVKYHNVHPTV